MPRKPWKKYSWNNPFSNWLKYSFAADYEKSIQALVYAGAALLVIIVGLRGLGNISDVPLHSRFPSKSGRKNRFELCYDRAAC